MSRSLNDEWNRDDWDGQDWCDEVTHPRSARVEESELERIENREAAALNDDYVVNWRSISDRKRALCNYCCEVCGVELRDNLWLLHVHHLDRDKTNNDDNNLQVLCAICHSVPDDHQHLRDRITATESAFILLRRGMLHGAVDTGPKKDSKEMRTGNQPPRILDAKAAAFLQPAASVASLTDLRKIFSYMGYACVANFWNGQYQGRADSKIEKRTVAVVGSSMKEIMKQLGTEIRKQHAEWIEEQRPHIPERHQRYVLLRRVEYKGIRAPSTTPHRTDNCYSCKTAVDNALDAECIACGWIICSNCAACGCGYSRYR